MSIWPWGKSKTFLETEDEAWVAEVCAWLIRHLGGIDAVRKTPLVKPNADFFPATEAKGHGRAEHIFACVKRHAGMGDWPCRLEAQPERPQLKVGEFWSLKPEKGQLPGGTFSVEANQAVVTYDPASINEPGKLIATLAHELAHYRLATWSDPSPGGADLHEYCTDIAVVFLGFGLFGANAAFNFEQHQGTMSQGWRWSRQGYLGEREWAFALAIFIGLRAGSDDELKPFMKPHLFGTYRKARQYLARHAEILDGISAVGST